MVDINRQLFKKDGRRIQFHVHSSVTGGDIDIEAIRVKILVSAFVLEQYWAGLTLLGQNYGGKVVDDIHNAEYVLARPELVNGLRIAMGGDKHLRGRHAEAITFIQRCIHYNTCEPSGLPVIHLPHSTQYVILTPSLQSLKVR